MSNIIKRQNRIILFLCLIYEKFKTTNDTKLCAISILNNKFCEEV